MKVCSRSRGIAPLILHLASSSRWVVSVILPPLCAWERILLSVELKTEWVPESVETVLEKRKSLIPTGIRTPDRAARSQVSVPASGWLFTKNVIRCTANKT